MNRIMRTALAVAISVAAVGCATNEAGVSAQPKAGFDPAKAYAYGRFHLEAADRAALPADVAAGASMGLKFACDGGQGFTIVFSPPQQADQVMEVPADRCSLVAITYVRDGVHTLDKPFSGNALQDLTFAKGNLHYVGDMSGKLWFERQFTTHAPRWKLTSISKRFIDTTRRVVDTQPHYANAPRTDLSGNAARFALN